MGPRTRVSGQEGVVFSTNIEPGEVRVNPSTKPILQQIDRLSHVLLHTGLMATSLHKPHISAILIMIKLWFRFGSTQNGPDKNQTRVPSTYLCSTVDKACMFCDVLILPM